MRSEIYGGEPFPHEADGFTAGDVGGWRSVCSAIICKYSVISPATRGPNEVFEPSVGDDQRGVGAIIRSA